LGEDLPGAVQVVGEVGSDLEDEAGGGPVSLPTLPHTSEYDFKFSLAGVQLKFSVMRGERGVTVPLHGEHGDYIAKLPDERHDGVPENEFTMMTWAREAGIDVPEFSLIEANSIQGVPQALLTSAKKAFLIRRFDRTATGRVHIEDFAQVLNRYPTPEGKYGGANYETVARIVLAVGGMHDLEEFVRRIVALVAMGNGDAHLKNWSLIYEDGRTARLSPVYDLVSTVTYVSTEEALALNLAGSKVFSEVTLASFRRLARKLELPSETALDHTVRDTVERLRSSWPTIRESMPLRDRVKRSIDDRLRELPLMKP
jgi:serine/threonine-protein kinase HipA